MYQFEKLKVWHEASLLVKLVYNFSQKLPAEEKFSLMDQLKRASTSIVLNIAEGTGGLGDVEFRSFLRNALKSLYETVAGVKLAQDLFGTPGQDVLMQAEIVGKQLNALINSLKTKD